MQYLGGKTMIGKELGAVISSYLKPESTYYEPFLGGCSVAPYVTADTKVLGDVHPDLMMLWEALYNGTFDPPETLSEQEYQELKHAGVNPLRGFAGFGCSFSGKWFGGYARGREGRNYCLNARNACLKKVKALKESSKTVSFVTTPYWELEYEPLPGDVFYCDPPYAKATKYNKTQDFDTEAFLNWARLQAGWGVIVLVSEYYLPGDHEVVWEKSKKLGLRTNQGGQETRMERLYRIRS